MKFSLPYSAARHLRRTVILTIILLTSFPIFAQDSEPSDTPAQAPESLELFLLVGQSNMAGRGKLDEADKKAFPGIWTLDRNDEWVNLGEPVHFDKPAAGAGLAFAFARKLLETAPDFSVGLIPCAVGGTPQSQWMPGSALYEESVRRTKIAMKQGTLKAILWHQGESDSKDEKNATEYAENLAEIVRGFRRDLNAPDVPFIAGELGGYIADFKDNQYPYYAVINEQINSLPSLCPGTAVVSAKGLTDKGDKIHFDTPSLRELGARYLNAYKSLE